MPQTDYPWRPKVLKLRRFLFWLLVLPLGGFTLAYLILLVQVCQLKPTGDPLFDRYARAVRNRQAWQLFAGFNGHPAALPDAQLAAWEPEFGTDPRYWELRYFCGLARTVPAMDPARMHFRDEAANELANIHLQESVERGITRQATLLYHSTLVEREQRLAALKQMAEADPDNEWGWYRYAFAFIVTQQPEQETAALLQRGNAAGHCTRPHCFPLDMVLLHRSSDDAAGSDFVSGAVLEIGQLLLGREDLNLLWSKRFDNFAPLSSHALRGDFCLSLCRIGACTSGDYAFSAGRSLRDELHATLEDSRASAAERLLCSDALRKLNDIQKNDFLYRGAFIENYRAYIAAYEWNINFTLAQAPPPDPSTGSAGWLTRPQAFGLLLWPSLRYKVESRAAADNAAFNSFQARQFTELSQLNWSILNSDPLLAP